MRSASLFKMLIDIGGSKTLISRVTSWVLRPSLSVMFATYTCGRSPVTGLNLRMSGPAIDANNGN